MQERGLEALLHRLDRQRVVPIPLPVAALQAVVGRLQRIGAVEGTCLFRSLALYALLKRTGHDATFFIGVRADAQAGFLAHAWVAVDARPLDETARHYEAIFEHHGT